VGNRADGGRHHLCPLNRCQILSARQCNTLGVKYCISIPNHEHEHQLHS
jgi:hypothetical protein